MREVYVYLQDNFDSKTTQTSLLIYNQAMFLQATV